MNDRDRFTGSGTRVYCAKHRYGDAGGLPCPGCSTQPLLTVLLPGGEKWTRVAREVPIRATHGMPLQQGPLTTRWVWADPSEIEEGAGV